MTITKNSVGGELTLVLAGRLDTMSSPQLDREIKDSLAGVTTLVLDFGGIEYISSAGLRVVFSAQKAMKKQGKLIIRSINESVKEVFEITGALDILAIEP